ncbi:hypothetical protein ENBRE01_2937 [Enteropsectra breve]|nr:hypothetical protein ENBRE01_2937 [Enteropsectra breve]
MEESQLNIKMCLIQIFENKPVNSLDAAPMLYSKNEAFSDFDVSELIRTTIPFVKGCHAFEKDPRSCLAYFTQYLDDYFSLGRREDDDTAGRTLHQIYRHICENKHMREEKMFIHKILSEFQCAAIDWADKERVLEILKYCAAKSLKTISWIDNGNSKETAKRPATSMYRVESDGKVTDINIRQAIKPSMDRREDLLKRRIAPTMSLDDYADLVLDEMSKREASKADKTVLEEQMFSEESEDKRNKEKIKKADLKEDRRCNHGNTFKNG